MTYMTDADRYRTRIPGRCPCGHWNAIHVERDTRILCTANRCMCEELVTAEGAPAPQLVGSAVPLLPGAAVQGAAAGGDAP